MLERHIDENRYARSAQLISGAWEDLGEGAPSLIALAQICAYSLMHNTAETADLEELSVEAQAILFTTRNRGVIEVKGTDIAFEAPERYLAVQVETEFQETVTFRNRENPEFTMRCFDGLRQLCAAGLAVHHIYRDFSLSAKGFELARLVDKDTVKDIVSTAERFGDR